MLRRHLHMGVMKNHNDGNVMENLFTSLAPNPSFIFFECHFYHILPLNWWAFVMPFSHMLPTEVGIAHLSY